jgi:hypothetical protein
MSVEVLRNVTFDDIRIGDNASLVHVVGRDDIALFAAVSGDANSAHMDPKYAATDTLDHIVVHAMWTGALVSAVLGTRLPGPAQIYLGQELRADPRNLLRIICESLCGTRFVNRGGRGGRGYCQRDSSPAGGYFLVHAK